MRDDRTLGNRQADRVRVGRRLAAVDDDRRSQVRDRDRIVAVARLDPQRFKVRTEVHRHPQVAADRHTDQRRRRVAVGDTDHIIGRAAQHDQLIRVAAAIDRQAARRAAHIIEPDHADVWTGARQ